MHYNFLLLLLATPHANVFTPNFNSVPPISHSFNPSSDTFIPASNISTNTFITPKNIFIENRTIATLPATILIISSLVSDGINRNDTHTLCNLSPSDIFKKLKIDNGNKIVIGHLNINSIRNKCLKYISGFNADILFISETKLDDTFPSSQFQIDGYLKSYRKDRNDKVGDLLLYIRDF